MMDIKEDFSKLNKFINELSGDSYLKIGVLKNGRSNDYLVNRHEKFKNDPRIPYGIKKGLISVAQDNPSNADVGACLEFGVASRNIPARPWLMPSILRLTSEIDKNKKLLFNVLAKKQSRKSLLSSIGIMAESEILKTFETEGQGKWSSNSPITTILKGSSRPGWDTGQLQQAVTSEVIDK